MIESFSPEELQALREDIFASLHCALPGTVESYDPESGTADIRPGLLSRSGRALPLLRSVPVFRPNAWNISPGDRCLVIFADADIGNWLVTGEPSSPQSARRHSLSDGFAFVGFG